MQVVYPPQGLLPYPNADFGQQMNDFTKSLMTLMQMKKQNEDDKARRQLELFMKSGELTGELSKPSPEIQKAFKRVYRTEPQGIFATGGETLAGREAKAKIKLTEAETDKQLKMGEWYKNRLAGGQDPKELDFGLKYANGKLGKPFEVLAEDERRMWQTYFDEGVAQYKATTGKSSAGMNSPEKLKFINSYKSLPSTEKNRLTDPATKSKFEARMTSLGITWEDLK